MVTTAEDEGTQIGAVQQIGHAAEKIYATTTETTYGRRDASLYPLILIGITAIAILLDWPLVGMVPLILLAVWVGGHR